jgi:MFS family permease
MRAQAVLAYPHGLTANVAHPLLRVPGFAIYLFSRFMQGLILRGLAVAVGYHIYELTGDPVALGYVGLAMFVPVITLGLVAGDIADRMNRAVMLIISSAAAALSCAGLFVITILGVTAPMPFYLLTALFGMSLAFARPAMPSLVPQLVGPEQTPNGIALASAIAQSATILGPPVIGAVLIFGPAAAYAVMTGIAALTAFCWTFLIPYARIGIGASLGQPIIKRIAAGFGIVWRNKLILGAMSLDLFAVLLGSVIALLPVFARDILMVGPFCLGLLPAAPAVGAVLMAVVFARIETPRPAGTFIFGGAALFGISIVVFGLSTSFILSLAALFVSGVADMISNILRNSAVQLSATNEMRGRVNSVNQVFISGANELGDFRAGVSAGLIGAVPAALLGGACTIVIAGLWAWLFPSLRKLDRLTDIKPGETRAGKTGMQPLDPGA